MAHLEHVNLTVTDARKTAAFLQDLLDWHIRWEGPALNGGFTIHVGGETSYLALYTPKGGANDGASDKTRLSNMNHIGIVVPDLDAVEARVKTLGYTPYNHADYEPGRRFYFDGPDGVEYEVVCYGE